MDALDKKKITKELIFLTENTTNISHVVVGLIAEEVLLPFNKNQIMAPPSDIDKCFELYDMLMRKGPNTFGKLIKVLRATGNEAVADRLEEPPAEVSKKKNKVKESEPPKVAANSFKPAKPSGAEGSNKDEVKQVDVHQIATMMSNSSVLNDMKEQLFGALGLPFAELHTLQNQFMYNGFKSYTFYASMLELWLEKLGSDARIGTILSALHSLELKALEDEIRSWWRNKKNYGFD